MKRSRLTVQRSVDELIAGKGKARILTKIAQSELFFSPFAWFGAFESK